MHIRILFFGLFLLFMSSVVSGQNIRLSFKLLADPSDGSTPTYATEAYIDAIMDWMNATMSSHQRGITFTREATFTVESIYHDSTVNENVRNLLEAAAEADPSTYFWRENRINIYFSSGPGSAICSFPAGDEVILMGAGNNGADGLLHEIGHFFNLCHTQGCPCGACDGGGGVCDVTPGNDEIDDTLPDLQCWDRDDISNHSFGVNYSSLTTTQQEQVNDVWFNVMSYHNASSSSDNRNRFTEDQLDRFVQTMFEETNRLDVISGLPIYVDDDNFCSLAGFSCIGCNGSPDSPYDKFYDCAISIVNTARNIVVLKPGIYEEPDILINTACTLVGTNAGNALIK